MEDNKRRFAGGFGPYECSKCHRMNCGAHSNVCYSCSKKQEAEE